MAAKGRKAQLQSEIKTSQDLTLILDQYPGNLFLLDIYTECYGPCKPMVPSLRKIKAGTDVLQMAVVDCGDIEALKRFRNRSGPSWLFVLNGRVINSFFGCNIPALAQLLRNELNYLQNIEESAPRKTFELNQMTETEAEINKTMKMDSILKKRAAAAAIKMKAHNQLKFAIDEIIEHAQGSGVTIFMPHVLSRDLFKKVVGIGDGLGLSARDRTMAVVTPEHLQVINFEKERMPYVLFDHIKAKEVFMICWKTNDDELEPVEKFLKRLKAAITVDEADDDALEPEEGSLSLRQLSIVAEKKCVETFVRLNSIDVMLTIDEMEFIRYVIDFSINYAIAGPMDDAARAKRELAEMLNVTEDDDRFLIATKMIDELIESVAGGDGEKSESEGENADPVVEQGKEEEEKEEIEDYFDPSDPTKAHIPPVWTPSDAVGNAALIYLFFRQLTDYFLDPDPIPDPPHVLMVFCAQKWKDIHETAKPYGNALICFGYFTSSDWKNAELLATSHTDYKRKGRPKTMRDKLILKVSEESDVLLMLTGLMPDYVSQNETDGKIECERFFASAYRNTPEVDEELESEEEEEEEEEESEEDEEELVEDGEVVEG